MKIAFIVQRYGAEILGGSEYHCRLIAERLALQARRRGADDVRARLHHLGERLPRGHRPDPRRDGAALQERAHRATSPRSTSTPTGSSTTRTRATTRCRGSSSRARGARRCIEYLNKQSSPVRRADLLHLSLCADGARLEIDPARTILVPTAHDEPAIRLVIYQDLFKKPAAVAFNTEVEKNFLKTTFEFRSGRRRDRRLRRRPDAGRGAAGRSGAGRRRGDPQAAGAAPARAWRAVPPPAPPAGTVPALRRTHRRRQGLRRADRVLHELQGAGRRRAADADGREADAAARGAVGPVRRACSPNASGCRRSRPRRSSSCRHRSRACRCWRSKRWRSARRCCATRGRTCWSSTA